MAELCIELLKTMMFCVLLFGLFLFVYIDIVLRNALQEQRENQYINDSYRYLIINKTINTYSF